ncbi:hypothetical protein TNCV_3959471 [Trichonephila clavipes]|uniref:Uncharacterized protein n=1 Tax=Trichonephila clavipes TaxID=2585209 RepID=A0A8X6V4A0_TRICX|nr:hypothetical protein TNCV_3959471 [Trichonephila clavipes]
MSSTPAPLKIRRERKRAHFKTALKAKEEDIIRTPQDEEKESLFIDEVERAINKMNQRFLNCDLLTPRSPQCFSRGPQSSFI